MSADYDRLFHSSGDAVQTAEEESERGTAAPMPTGGHARTEVTPPPMPIAPAKTAAAPAPPPRQAEVTTQMPPARTAPQQRQPNGMLRASQATSAGARFEQPRSAPTPPPRPAPAPAPSQHFAEAQSETSGTWRASQSSASQPATTSAATIGNHRAIDALSHVG